MKGIPREETKKAVYDAGQWLLMWLAFKKHKLALIGGVIVAFAYFVALFAEILAPQSPDYRNVDGAFIPPMKIHVLDGGRVRLPFIYGVQQARDPVTLRLTYREDRGRIYPIRLFVHGDAYKVWGIFPFRLHIIGCEGNQRLYLLGTDQQGRDLLSRMIMGTRISLSIGLIGVAISFVLALVIGGLSGFFAGAVDTIIQRIIEVLTSIPKLPLWMALAVAVPFNWPITRVFFVITVILSLISWPGLARQIRGKILSLKEIDYVVAARLDNARTPRLLRSYLLPAVMSHIIASLTLQIPSMILGETSLSFLGIGLRAPAISWGVLLQAAQNIQTVILSPWLLLPVVPIVLVILAFNFLGDGLRDAADPYKS